MVDIILFGFICTITAQSLPKSQDFFYHLSVLQSCQLIYWLMKKISSAWSSTTIQLQHTAVVQRLSDPPVRKSRKKMKSQALWIMENSQQTCFSFRWHTPIPPDHPIGNNYRLCSMCLYIVRPVAAGCCRALYPITVFNGSQMSLCLFEAHNQ